MKKIYLKLSKSFAVNLLSSLEMAVACLGLLAILTFWGTLYQADYGLYAAQNKFFGSWFFTTMGFLPFPGARLVLWVFAINLTVSIIFRQSHRWTNFGILLIHYGMLLLLVGAFVIFHYAKESHVTFVEGQGTNVSADYRTWELAVWKDSAGSRAVRAVDIQQGASGRDFELKDFGLTVSVKEFYPHCDAFTGPSGSDVKSFKSRTPSAEPEKNTPGVVLKVSDGQNSSDLLLAGQITTPAAVTLGDKKYSMQLRHVRYPIPLTIKLKDFRMEEHPGTDMAKSFESTVEIDTGAMTRDVVISMNRPLRFNEYTFYQASYMIGENGEEYSTLAVVRNKGRIIPYLATLITGLGLVNHFFVRLIMFLRKKNSKGKKT